MNVGDDDDGTVGMARQGVGERKRMGNRAAEQRFAEMM